MTFGTTESRHIAVALPHSYYIPLCINACCRSNLDEVRLLTKAHTTEYQAELDRLTASKNGLELHLEGAIEETAGLKNTLSDCQQTVSKHRSDCLFLKVRSWARGSRDRLTTPVVSSLLLEVGT